MEGAAAIDALALGVHHHIGRRGDRQHRCQLLAIVVHSIFPRSMHGQHGHCQQAISRPDSHRLDSQPRESTPQQSAQPRCEQRQYRQIVLRRQQWPRRIQGNREQTARSGNEPALRRHHGIYGTADRPPRQRTNNDRDDAGLRATQYQLPRIRIATEARQHVVPKHGFVHRGQAAPCRDHANNDHDHRSRSNSTCRQPSGQHSPTRSHLFRQADQHENRRDQRTAEQRHRLQ